LIAMKNKSISKVRIAAGVAACVVSGLMAAPAQAAATIDVFNNNAAGVGFNDPTPAVPVGGNTGVTLGQQRQIVFLAAAQKWGATLNSNVQIRVLAMFTPLACDANSAVLGSAGARSVNASEPEFPLQETWYPAALADKLTGVDLDPSTATVFNWDITARFNSNLGLNANCLPSRPFYLGLDNNHGAGIDLYAVLLHELGHGLGFQTFTDDETGEQFLELPSVWDHLLRDQTLGLDWTQMTNAQRQASAINTNNLVWTGTNVRNNATSVLLGIPQLAVSGPAAGATAGIHVVGTAGWGAPLANPGVVGEIMPVSPSAAGEGCNPFSAADKLAVNGNIALISRGVCAFTQKAKNAQLAGAKAVIISDNVVAAPLGLGGADPTITITAVGVTLADGNALRTAALRRSRTKSGVIGDIGLSPTNIAGLDPSGFIRMYAPNPDQPGSSVSHYDVSAFRNLLMEPAINPDLSHEVTPPADLTLPLLQDIGW
jgi:hypothetical protein